MVVGLTFGLLPKMAKNDKQYISITINEREKEMSFWDKILGKRTEEFNGSAYDTTELEKKFAKELGLDGSPEQKEIAAKNIQHNAIPGFTREEQFRSAAIETVRDITLPGSVTKKEMMRAIAEIMNSGDNWKRKYDALDLLDTRAINGISDYYEEKAVRKEISEMQERLLRQGGRL